MFVDKGRCTLNLEKPAHIISDYSSAFLQDLHRVMGKLQEKQLKEKEEGERQGRITAKLKEKVRLV